MGKSKIKKRASISSGFAMHSDPQIMRGDPVATLSIEFYGDEISELEAAAEHLRNRLGIKS